MSGARNLFGECVPLHDLDATIAALGIGAGDSVLEVGGAGNPFPRANVVCDLTFGSCAQRNGAPGVLRADVRYVEAPAEALPFADGEFDFVYCTQVLEHVRDPLAACRELSRVARRGFVEMPSRFGELLNGNPTHRWIVDRENDVLVFEPRAYIQHPLANVLYGLIFKDSAFRELCERTLRNLFNHQLAFEGRLEARLRPAAGPAFDYDDRWQAGLAHASFARNTLLGGAPPDYAYADALEAVRLLPESREARLLLAVYQARVFRPADALRTLEGLPGVDAEALRGLIVRLARGEPLDARTLPVPPEPSRATDARPPLTRPRVSVVVAGEDARALLEPVESALTQDYPEVDVVAAAPGSFGAEWSRLGMGARLKLLPQPPGTPLGACLNRAAMSAGGEILAFLLAPERFMAHHVDRMVASLLVSGAAAVHGDRLLVTGEGVVGPDIEPGNPATSGASVSTVAGRREALVAVGAFEEAPGEGSVRRWLLRLAAAVRLEHVREATVEGRGPLPAGAEVLDLARSAERLEPLELFRSLVAAHAREDGLRSRVRALEDQSGRAGVPAGDRRS